MNKFYILSLMFLLFGMPSYSSILQSNTIAQSTTERILNRVFNNGNNQRYDDRYYNDNNRSRRYNRQNNEYNKNYKNNNNNRRNERNRYSR